MLIYIFFLFVEKLSSLPDTGLLQNIRILQWCCPLLRIQDEILRGTESEKLMIHYIVSTVNSDRKKVNMFQRRTIINNCSIKMIICSSKSELTSHPSAPKYRYLQLITTLRHPL